MGHPVVHIKQTTPNELVLTQTHFLLDPSSMPTEASDYK